MEVLEPASGGSGRVSNTAGEGLVIRGGGVSHQGRMYHRKEHHVERCKKHNLIKSAQVVIFLN